MIKMKCPHCGHQLRIKDKYAGTRGGCKHCGGFFQVSGVCVPTPPPQQHVPPPPVTASKLEKMDGMPALDPGFAQKMAGMEVEQAEPSTALADLKDAPAVTSPGLPPAQVHDNEGLGCLFWGVVFFLPPIGLVWSFFIPGDHPSKGRAIIAAVLLLLLAILCAGMGTLLGAQVTASPPQM